MLQKLHHFLKISFLFCHILLQKYSVFLFKFCVTWIAIIWTRGFWSHETRHWYSFDPAIVLHNHVLHRLATDCTHLLPATYLEQGKFHDISISGIAVAVSQNFIQWNLLQRSTHLLLFANLFAAQIILESVLLSTFLQEVFHTVQGNMFVQHEYYKSLI